MYEEFCQQLEELMKRQANEQWLFNKENYPPMDGMSEQDQYLFAIQHILKHEAKSLGDAFRAMEAVDHTASRWHDQPLLRRTAINMFANVVRLAERLKIPSEELMKALLPH